MKRQRNATLDVARGFTVLIMTAVHCVLTYSRPVVQKSPLGTILGFLAEGPGAELFMMLMGISIVLGRKKTIRQIFTRTFTLLITAYLLNFVKIILPLSWHGIPGNVFTENGIPYNRQGILLLLFMDDILQTAAVCYLVCSLLYRAKYYFIWGICAAFICNFLSPALWKLPIPSGILHVPVNILVGMPPAAFFPVFPWIVYPLLGLSLGYGLQYFDTKKLYVAIAVMGICFITLGKGAAGLEPGGWENNFYRLGPGGTMYHGGIALLWLCLCHLSVRFIKGTYFFRLLAWLSKHITLVYCLQWIFIFWLSPLFSYHHLGMAGTLASIAILTLLTFFTTWAIIWIRSKRPSNNGTVNISSH